MLGLETSILLVNGKYSQVDPMNHDPVFKNYAFKLLDKIDLFKLDLEIYDEDHVYLPAFTETVWNFEKYKRLLKAIADDEACAFFLSFERNIIIAPYGGGIDFILKDVETKNYYKNKYKEWLSVREDGL